MKISKKISTIFLFLSLMLFSNLLQAQANFHDLNDALGFEDTVNDVPEAAIQFFIPLALLIGAYLGILKVKK